MFKKELKEPPSRVSLAAAGLPSEGDCEPPGFAAGRLKELSTIHF